MEIKRLGDNKIRCALSEEEIQKMGFSIDDIIGNTEMTQKFMQVVLNLVEEKENISLEGISPMVKAELLQDHSMAITFGGESENSFRSLLDTVNHLMSQLEPDKLKEFKNMNLEEKKNRIDEFLKEFGEKNGQPEAGAEKESDALDTEIYEKNMPFGMEFFSLDDVIRFASLFRNTERLPENSLYKLENHFMLLMNFKGFARDELRPLAFAAVEFDGAHFSEELQMAYIREHGSIIIKNEALQTLMQL